MIFSRLGLHFGTPWASKLEPSWPFWPPKTLVQLPWGLLKLNVFSKCRLGRLQARFWRVCGGSWEGLGRVLGQKKNWPCPKTPRNAKNLSRTCQDLARTQRLSKKVLLDGEQGGPLQQLGRRCPPPGWFQKMTRDQQFSKPLASKWPRRDSRSVNNFY